MPEKCPGFSSWEPREERSRSPLAGRRAKFASHTLAPNQCVTAFWDSSASRVISVKVWAYVFADCDDAGGDDECRSRRQG